MPVYMIKEQGAYVKRMDERIVVEKNGKTLADVPVLDITNLSVFGNVQVTTQALHLLLEQGIDVSFFSYSGEEIGQVVSDKTKNVFLRMAQYDRYMDLEYRLQIARSIVRSKVHNQIAVIERFNWYADAYDYTEDVRRMQEQVQLLPLKVTSNEIMGIEGNCSAIYFGVYAHMFKCSIRFDGRNRRPPKDPINIILSLAYTLLTKEVASALAAESFETYLGFLHGIRYGRKSLALDIVEAFRQPVVDRLVLYLFNKSIMGELDFETLDERINLTESGFKKFCREYEKWMTAPSCKADPRSFRVIIREQVAELKRAFKNGTDYMPFEWGNGDVSDQL